jgi:DNA-binding NtrC family response regulator
MTSPLAESAPSSREPAWADYAVLVVDDEAGVRNFLQRALQARGCRVDIAGSAEEGAERLVEHHFDAIVLDIALPGRSGMDWLRSLKNGGFAGDVILITAFADIETAIDALRAGASDFVLKPFRVDQIVNSCSAASSGPASTGKTSCCSARWPGWAGRWKAWSAIPGRCAACPT